MSTAETVSKLFKMPFQLKVLRPLHLQLNSSWGQSQCEIRWSSAHLWQDTPLYWLLDVCAAAATAPDDPCLLGGCL